MLDVAKTLDFMRSPPGNRLEALRGDRAGQWSVRINDLWRGDGPVSNGSEGSLMIEWE